MSSDQIYKKPFYRRFLEILLRSFNPIHTGLFLAGVVPGPGGDVFHLHPVTPLAFKSDDSNFVQNYFGVGSIFWGKKNRDQIDNDVTMTSYLL